MNLSNHLSWVSSNSVVMYSYCLPENLTGLSRSFTQIAGINEANFDDSRYSIDWFKRGLVQWTWRAGADGGIVHCVPVDRRVLCFKLSRKRIGCLFHPNLSILCCYCHVKLPWYPCFDEVVPRCGPWWLELKENTSILNSVEMRKGNNLKGVRCVATPRKKVRPLPLNCHHNIMTERHLTNTG